MNRHGIFRAAICCLLFAACKKDENNQGSVSDYTRYKPGNYWIYQSYQVDDQGNGSPGNQLGNGISLYDSVYVEKDTMIRQYTYHKLMKPVEAGNSMYEATFLRDSLNYEVDAYGNVVLAISDFSTIFQTKSIEAGPISNDSLVVFQDRMADPGKIITVPAGTFTTISLDKIISFIPYKGQQPSSAPRKQHFRYASGVGMVTETLPFYSALPNYTERRLVRYSVK